MSVVIERRPGWGGAEQVKCESPFHPAFPEAARQLGGKWNPVQVAWFFDIRDEDRVRQLCRDLFGTDGSCRQSAEREGEGHDG